VFRQPNRGFSGSLSREKKVIKPHQDAGMESGHVDEIEKIAPLS
jgi:hypothetical protein